ncbi:MAG TPA: DUF4198 domain-containing protein [Acidobacteriota bacterium]|nr:DUF4198 domain-containing protein [Acidobacteriota bacterium]
MKWRCGLAGFLILSFALTAFAHDLYLQPVSFYLDSTDKTSVEMRLTENGFPGIPLKWRGNRSVQLKTSGPAGDSDIPNSEGINPQLKFDKPGTYQIGWQSKETYISIDPKTFNTYIKLENYKDAIEKRRTAGNENTEGRERYSRFIKTFVQVGTEKSDHFTKPLGFKIEIIPKQNPSGLHVGDELDVLVLFEGQPLASNRVMVTYDKYSTTPEDYAQILETDSSGNVRIKITHSGLWLVRTNRMIALSGDQKADWESFWSNINV